MISIDGIINIPPEENLNHPSRQFAIGRGTGINSQPDPFRRTSIPNYPPLDSRRVQSEVENMLKNKTLSVNLNDVLKNRYLDTKVIYTSKETLVLEVYGKEIVFTVSQHGDLPILIGNAAEPSPEKTKLFKAILEDSNVVYSYRMNLLTGDLLVDINSLETL